MIRRLILLAPIALAMVGCATPDLEAQNEPPVVIFFTGDSAALEDSGVALVRAAAATAARYPNASVRVLGFADPEGGRRFNQALSRARAEHVANHLIESGVAANRIRTVARGPVPFEFMEMESRRVEIRFGE
jgi:outer membrane protein OmpA-like peptidoglycan-associated protein